MDSFWTRREESCHCHLVYAVSDTVVWTWGWGINLHPRASLDILVPDGASPAVDSAPKGPGISSRRIHHSRTRPLILGAEAPVGSTCPRVFTLWLRQPPPTPTTPRAHFIPCCFPVRSEVIWGCETTLHVQRHSFKVTFTLKPAVISIRPHITGRSKVEVLLMLTEGHTSDRQNTKIITERPRVKTTKQHLEEIRALNASVWDADEEELKEEKTTIQKTKRKAAKQRSIAFKRKRKLLLQSEQRLYKRIVLLHLFYILWPKNITDLIGPKCDAWGSFIHPKPVWPSFSCPPPTKLPFPLPTALIQGAPGLTLYMCVCVCVGMGSLVSLIVLLAKVYTVSNTQLKNPVISVLNHLQTWKVALKSLPSINNTDDGSQQRPTWCKHCSLFLCSNNVPNDNVNKLTLNRYSIEHVHHLLLTIHC